MLDPDMVMTWKKTTEFTLLSVIMIPILALLTTWQLYLWSLELLYQIEINNTIFNSIKLDLIWSMLGLAL